MKIISVLCELNRPVRTEGIDARGRRGFVRAVRGDRDRWKEHWPRCNKGPFGIPPPEGPGGLYDGKLLTPDLIWCSLNQDPRGVYIQGWEIRERDGRALPGPGATGFAALRGNLVKRFRPRRSPDSGGFDGAGAGPGFKLNRI